MKPLKAPNIIGIGLLFMASVAGALLLSINGLRLPAIIFGYLGMLAVCYRLKLSRSELGLDSRSLKKGFMLGLTWSAGIVLIMSVALLINSDWFLDERYNRSLGKILLYIFVTLPATTVLFEELWFRGITYAVMARRLSGPQAAKLSALAFGVWHTMSAAGFSFSGLRVSRLVTTLIVVIATSIAGWIFIRLRQSSGSLVAPVMVHYSINATGVILAYLAWHR
ncbi:MAG: CPBP family intramembrane glutamic endopeptidase [Candidatus Saccharimonadales bacterium]